MRSEIVLKTVLVMSHLLIYTMHIIGPLLKIFCYTNMPLPSLNLLTIRPSKLNEWVALNFNQILTSRQTKFISAKANKRKVGLNALANRAYVLNNRIPLEWFNMSFDAYKVHCKKEFVQ